MSICFWHVGCLLCYRQRKVAEENLGEVCVSVNNKGCVVSQSTTHTVYFMAGGRYTEHLSRAVLTVFLPLAFSSFVNEGKQEVFRKIRKFNREKIRERLQAGSS